MEALKKWTVRGIAGAGVLAAVAVLLGTLRSGAADVPKPKDLRVAERTAPATRGGADYRLALPAERDGWIAGQGIVEPADREVKVGAPQAGLVTKILVHEGERVRAGQPLVELEDTVERAELEAATADLARAESERDRAREGRRAEEVRAQGADERAARARAELSRIGLERSKLLKERGAATAEELDRARLTAEIDQATREGQAARAEAAARPWRRDLEVQQAGVSQARAKLAEARARLDRLTVKAPSAAAVLQVAVREGEFENPASGTPLMVLGDLSVIRVRLDVDERSLAAVREGQRGYVTVEAFGGRKFQGQVVEVARRMGRKNLRTDEPTERIDTKILEVVLKLDDGRELTPGLRAFGYLQPAGT